MDKVLIIVVILLAIGASRLSSTAPQDARDVAELKREMQDWMKKREAIRESGMEEAREGHWDLWEMDEWRDDVEDVDEEWKENLSERQEAGRTTKLPALGTAADTAGAAPRR